MSTESGIHIRGVAITAEDEPGIALLTVQIWPLPYEVVEELNLHIRDTTNKWLAERQLVSGQLTDLTAKGLPQ